MKFGNSSVSQCRSATDEEAGLPPTSLRELPWEHACDETGSEFHDQMEGNDVKEKRKKSNGERRRSSNNEDSGSSLTVNDEIKKFKENLLQSVSNGDSILSDTSALLEVPRPRERSGSRARDALMVPKSVLAELDETKIFELKEAFLLFDMDGDGCIDHNDLRATLVSLGERVDEQAVKNMLAEAPSPLDFDGFVNLLGYRTLELDSEETLVAALSRWDNNNSGFISEERIRHDLMTWGDRFSEKEADYALEEAPTITKGGNMMIDYVKFCSILSGLKKTKKD